MTDQELKDLVASLAVAQAETTLLINKLAEQSARTDIQLAKTEAQLAETDAQLARTDAQLAKTDAQLAKTDAKLDKLAKLFGDVNNNRGEIAEEFFFSIVDFLKRC